MTTKAQHALSFDIEDWFHLVDIDAVADPAQWPELPSLVERYTDWILDTLKQHDTHATFYVLGWIAERYPHLVRRMVEEGHEVGSHSYWHRRVYELAPEEFRSDMIKANDALHAAGVERVRGFRAPSFSITPGAEWAFDVLHDLDFEYDASLFPAPRGHGGYPCPREPHHFADAPSGKPMPELPMSTMTFMGKTLPFSGGGYMRLLPTWLIRKGFRQLEQQNLPTVVYLHPRDFAADCPKVPMPLKRRFKCYVGLSTTRKKLNTLLKEFNFTTCANILNLDH